jgi:ribulose-5-phosphate 4-epimerase/fuculose-1-phosphate aldolase
MQPRAQGLGKHRACGATKMRVALIMCPKSYESAKKVEQKMRLGQEFIPLLGRHGALPADRSIAN